MMKICLMCSRLSGCRLLGDAQGKFVPERLITEDSLINCNDWSPVASSKKEDVRKILYGIQGVNSLRVLHMLPEIVMNQLIEQESVDGMTEEMPDFAGMIVNNMTSLEREDQLRFETTPDGNFVEDNGVRRPRPSYQLRKFACDQEDYVKLDHSTGMFWATDKVINHIVSTEVELGFIIKAKKPGKGKASTKTAAKAAPETDMAAGRRVMINRTGKTAAKPPAAAAKGGGKLARPPAKKPSKAAKAEETGGNGATDGFDISTFVNDIKLSVGDAVDKSMSSRMEAMEEKMNELFAHVTAAKEEVLDAVTIFYDLACQSQGTFSFENEDGEMEICPEMYRNPDRILGHITGAETPPEE